MVVVSIFGSRPCGKRLTHVSVVLSAVVQLEPGERDFWILDRDSLFRSGEGSVGKKREKGNGKRVGWGGRGMVLNFKPQGRHRLRLPWIRLLVMEHHAGKQEFGKS